MERELPKPIQGYLKSVTNEQFVKDLASLGCLHLLTPPSYAGETIRSFYCNGFFGRRYDLSGSIVLSNTWNAVTIQTDEGEVITADLEGWEARLAELLDDWINQ